MTKPSSLNLTMVLVVRACILSRGSSHDNHLVLQSRSAMASGLSHAQKVTRLYRKSLKHLLSWIVDRWGHYCEEQRRQ